MSLLVCVWMVLFSIVSCMADAHSMQNVGNLSVGDTANRDTETFDSNVSVDSSLSSSTDPQVMDQEISLSGIEEQDGNSIDENHDGNTDMGLSDSSSDRMSNVPDEGKTRPISSSDRMVNIPDEGKTRPLYGGDYMKGMEWLLQKVQGSDPGLQDDQTTGDAMKVNITDGVKGNGTAESATVGNSSNLANETTFKNSSSTQSANASQSYNVSVSNVTVLTDSNSTSPNKSPAGGSSTAQTLIRFFLASLYVAGPSAGIFLISPIYAIATRNLMDYFIGSPDTVDLLHGAGIMGLVVDLTWGAVV